MAFGNVRCKTCQFHDVAALENMFARGAPVAAIARRFKLPYESVQRHCKAHIPPAVLASIEAKAFRAANAKALADLRADESENLLNRIVHTRRRINAILSQAEQDKDWRGAILAKKTLHENYTLSGKLIAELNTGTQVINQSLVVSPDYLKLRALLVQALQPFPAARIAVAKALRELENPSDEPKQIEAPSDEPIEAAATSIASTEPEHTDEIRSSSAEAPLEASVSKPQVSVEVKSCSEAISNRTELVRA